MRSGKHGGCDDGTLTAIPASQSSVKLRFALVPLILALGGCLAIPHLDVRSPQVSGSVVDGVTWEPLADVRVEFIENSALAVLTDRQGEFLIRLTRKPELFVPLGGGSGFDIGAKILPRLRVSLDGYAPLEVDAAKIENLEWFRHEAEGQAPPTVDGPFFLRPIVLERLPR